MPKDLDVSNIANEDAFFDYVSKAQQYKTEGNKSPKSSAAIAGHPQYLATSHTVSDILQGNLLQTNPQDTLLHINKALTDQLQYLAGDGIHNFGTLSTAEPVLEVVDSFGGGADGQARPGFDANGNVDVDWVRSLPTTHPDGPVIWHGQGKASREMHIPTAESLSEDVAQHKQYEDMPAEWKHPWNMDRRGGGVGGESGYHTSVTQGPTIMKGENANEGGQAAAFGYLDPESEQFYCSMAWPYQGDVPGRFLRAGRPDIAEIAKTLNRQQYKGKRILIYSVQTGKAVVATPGDWGPHPYHSNGTSGRASITGSYIGMSPDIHHYLGTDHGTEVIIRWMPDSTPLGPYEPNEGDAGYRVPGDINAIGATGSSKQNTLEEMKYAGEKIYNHPNNFNKSSSFRITLTEGFYAGHSSAPQVVPMWFSEVNRGFLMPSLLNYLWYAMEAGFQFGSATGFGAYVHRNVITGSGRLSNHAKGGAIDIPSIGYGDGRLFTYTSQEWRPLNDKLWNFYASLPRESKPSEAASSFAATYGWYKVYQDGNPNHIHLGFNENQVGKLIPQLLPPGARGIRSVNDNGSQSDTRVR